MIDIVKELRSLASSDDGISPYCCDGDVCEAAAAEIERLRHGVREISRFLDENRPGDASFVCAALLADEQSTEHCRQCGAEIPPGDLHGCPGLPGENQW